MPKLVVSAALTLSAAAAVLMIYSKDNRLILSDYNDRSGFAAPENPLAPAARDPAADQSLQVAVAPTSRDKPEGVEDGSDGLGTHDMEADASALLRLPSLNNLRAEIFLSHYARIAGIHDGMPREQVIHDAWLRADMMVVRSRLTQMVHESDDAADRHFEEGRLIASTGTYSLEALKSYAATIVAADDQVTETWRYAYYDFQHMDLESDCANFLAIHAMVASSLPTEECQGIDLEALNDGMFAIGTSYQEAFEATRIILNRVDGIDTGIALIGAPDDERIPDLASGPEI